MKKTSYCRSDCGESPNEDGTYASPLSRAASRALGISLLFASCLALAACGEKTVSDQVAAKGDDFELTLQEYDQVLRSLPPVTKDAIAPVRKAVLDNLIGEKLLADAAKKAGLDRDPDVTQKILASERTLLAQAYVRSLTGNSAPASQTEIQKYYNAHPESFSNRRKIVVREFIVPTSSPEAERFVTLFEKGGFEAVAANVASTTPSATPEEVTRYTDELVETSRKAGLALVPGSSMTYQTPGEIHLCQVISVAPAPVTIDQARNPILQTLAKERRDSIVKTAIKDLRTSRHVEIVYANLKQVTGKDPNASAQEAPQK